MTYQNDFTLPSVMLEHIASQGFEVLLLRRTCLNKNGKSFSMMCFATGQDKE